jgi:hypothetical protein
MSKEKSLSQEEEIHMITQELKQKSTEEFMSNNNINPGNYEKVS